MDVDELINLFKEFFKTFYYEDLLEVLRKGEDALIIDFNLLAKFNPAIAEELLENPEEIIKAAQLSLEQLDLDTDKKNINVRFYNLPETQKIMIRDIRSKHIGKLLLIEGIVRQKSDVRPQVVSAKFECPSCGAILPVLQLDQKFKEPQRCACGRKGKFRLLSKELVDAQRLTLEEAPEDLEGGEQPKRIGVILQKDLVSPISDKKTNPGSKIMVVGIIKEVPIILSTGGQSTRFDLMIDANYVDALQEDYTQIDISPEEEEEIIKFATRPDAFKKLIDNIAPTIYGHNKIKEALILQLLGGVKKERKTGASTRGDIHILLVGDPGAGKSVLLRRISKIAPKARFVSGKGASGAGLTASVVKDDFIKGWALEAGALVLANKGIVCIDELDKMSSEDRSAMHEALEQQSVTISKANIQASLRSETTVLAAANPKWGRFDPHELLAKQITLPNTLINRFDLIFPVRDLPNVESDEKLASFVLNLHKGGGDPESELDPSFIRKYIAYCRQRVKPVLSDEAMEEIKNYYVSMRNSGKEGDVKAIPISARQLEALVRLTEASAKVNLKKVADVNDAKRAISLLDYCLRKIGVDPETGELDIDRITTGITASKRSKVHTIKEIINELSTLFDNKIPIKDLLRECELKNISESEAQDIITRLKRDGEIYQPTNDYISKIE